MNARKAGNRLARLAALLLPVVLASGVLAGQGLLVRRRTPRLPEADGPRQGTTPPPYGTPAQSEPNGPLRLAVLGESTAAGVGVANHDEGLAGHLSRSLARRTGRAVEWQVAARSGANAKVTIRDLLPLLKPADLVVIVLGVNELLDMTPLRSLEVDLIHLIDNAPADRVVVTGMPPVARFPALPQPLRATMGLRARAIDRVLASAARKSGAHYAPTSLPAAFSPHNGPTFFAPDGFHPSARGYAAWAEDLASALNLLSPTE
ncbi:SGNH/GDSL hydrolase family protein [Sinosporangium siamense]|uniref:SGNH hydrolase n=1 Tax=Sinosporangium siamense TaxID=1367973 RepID=A0A919REY8_9ACTN|nr:SGNH/GDSL hydrolase family protein [Sinosporangium siamense]GII92661.1 SGNH hydrolase [Sinosporangium siamense]